MAAFDGGTNYVGKTQADNFVPELWSDEIIATYEKNLVAVPLIKNLSFEGKKGDKLNIPTPTRGAATAKAAGAAVTLIANVEGTTPVTIDQHWEYSRLIEDFAEVQALSSLRQFYTADAGYALATRSDTACIRLGRGVNGGTPTTAASFAYANAYIGSTGATAYNATNAAALADDGIRRALQRLDDADVPMEGRFIIAPPVSRNSILGNSRFSVYDTYGEKVIQTGKIGTLYGVPVFITTNADFATGGTNTDRAVLIGHRDFAVYVSQLKPRVQTQYKQEYLATLMTADMIYGTAELRDNGATVLVVPA
jgi:N4-gp56 family major capsid protein